jgi:YgiT-type zinc finger domain-containing protein
MERCPLCGGEKKSGFSTYSVDLGFGVVVVREVPSKVCNQCGEEWIESDVAKELERIVNNARANRLQIEVIAFEATFSK